MHEMNVHFLSKENEQNVTKGLETKFNSAVVS